MKVHWQDLSDNFYRNVLAIKLFFYTLAYVRATGDNSVMESLYGIKNY